VVRGGNGACVPSLDSREPSKEMRALLASSWGSQNEKDKARCQTLRMQRQGQVEGNRMKGTQD
jgi:hypothetical protein